MGLGSRPGGRTTNPEPVLVLRQRLGGQFDGPRYVWVGGDIGARVKIRVRQLLG